MPLQVVKVWDARQRAPVMELPNWHTNTINSIKCTSMNVIHRMHVTLHVQVSS